MIKRFLKEIIAIAALLLVLVIPLSTRALIPPLTQFGGTAEDFYPCTCSDASWLFFAPLYFGGVPLAGPIAYYPGGTYEYADYLGGLPGFQYLGGFVPGVQACWIYAGYFCFPLPEYGVMGMIGTGLGG